MGRFGLADAADERPLAGRADGLDGPRLQAGLRFQRPVIRHADIAQRAHPGLRACGRGRVGHRGCGRGGLGGGSVVGHGPRPRPRRVLGAGLGLRPRRGGADRHGRCRRDLGRDRPRGPVPSGDASRSPLAPVRAADQQQRQGDHGDGDQHRDPDRVGAAGGRTPTLRGGRGDRRSLRCVCRRAVGVWLVCRGRRRCRLVVARQPPRGVGADDAVDREPAGVLEASHRGLGPSAEAPIDRARTDARRVQLALQRADPTRPASPADARTTRQRHRRAQGGTGAGADDPVDHQPTGRLEPAHRGLGQRAKAPIDRARVDAHRAQTALQRAHALRPRGTVQPRAADQQHARTIRRRRSPPAPARTTP